MRNKPPVDNATILITGASSGIGAALARQLAPRAKALVLVARREERLRELAAELTSVRPELVVDVQRCDLTDLGAVDAMLARVAETVGDVDVLVNNAGMGDMQLFADASRNKLQRMVDLNVTAPTYLTHALLQGMIARRCGGILNISSGFGLAFMPGFATYVGTKHYITGWTESLRVELAGTGVAVTQSCPGPVETEFSDHAGSDIEDMPKFVRLTADQCAAASIKAFEKGRAMVIPGVGMKAIMGITRGTPRWLTRLALRPAVKRMGGAS